MATTIPPPSKRRRVAMSESSRNQQEIDQIPDNLGSVRVNFVDRATGQSAGPPVLVPVQDSSVKNLELLLNTLLKKKRSSGPEDASELIPYHFTYDPDESDPTQPDLNISDDLYHSVLKPVSKATDSKGRYSKTSEEAISLSYTPQAVFRVRAVTRCSSSIPGHKGAILAAAFSSSSSSRLITGSGDSTARIIDGDTGTPVHTLRGHTGVVLVVSWSPDESMVATASYDGSVRLWNPKTGESLGAPLKGHSKWINSLTWEPFHIQMPGRPRLASGSKDATVRVWDVVNKRIDMVLSGHTKSVTCVRWGGTGYIYTTSQDQTIKIWNADQGTLAHTLSEHAHWVNYVALSTDFVLRTAYHDHTGKVPPTQEEKIAKARDRFEKAATTGNGIVERLITASDDTTMFLWEPSKTTSPLAHLVGHQKAIMHAAFSPNGLLIASAGLDNYIKLWNARDGKFIATLKGHVAPVYQISFSPDSRLLVSGSKDSTLKVWEMATRKLKEDLPGHRDEVMAADWSPDGKKVVSGGKDKVIRIWGH